MPRFTQTLGNRSYVFDSPKSLLAKATPERSGDRRAGIAAESMEERVAAQLCLAALPLKIFLEEPLIPYEEDEVTQLILDTHDPAAFAAVSSLTVGELREWLLSYDTGETELTAVAPGLTPEMAAAVGSISPMRRAWGAPAPSATAFPTSAPKGRGTRRPPASSSI
jgi:ethanolamine ammonia-lyase large subunit